MHQLVTVQAEEHLFSQLLNLSHEDSLWQIAILHGSRMNPADRDMLRLREVPMLVAERLRGGEIATYLCSDGDLFLLYAGLMSEKMPIMETMLRDLLPTYSIAKLQQQELLTFHDVAYSTEYLLCMLRAKQEYAAQHPQPIAPQSLLEEAALEYEWNLPMLAHAEMIRNARRDKLALIVEDDAMMRQMAREVLSTRYGIIAAADGKQALALYNEHAPDLVLLDIRLPGMDGKRVLRSILTADTNARVVMFTSDRTADTLREVVTLGAKGFVTKPFTAATLLQHAHRAGV